MATSGRCGPEDVAGVVLGVDTHLEFHLAVVLDRLGRRLGESKARPLKATATSSPGRRGSGR